MSNTVRIITTKFVNTKDGTESFGFRIFDDYENLYSNLYDERIKDFSPLELLKEASDLCADKDSEMLVSVAENESGVEIDGEYFEWDEIKSVLE